MDEKIYIGKKINILAKRIHRKIDKEVSQYGMTAVQGRILGFIFRKSDKKDIFQKDIEEELDTEQNAPKYPQNTQQHLHTDNETNKNKKVFTENDGEYIDYEEIQ